MTFLDADYSAIEARITPWLAGQEDALAEYRLQDAATTEEEKFVRCRYRIQAAEIYRIPVLKATNHPHRFVGKFTVLGCGFGMGPPKFRESVQRFKYTLPEGLEFTAVKSWRDKHKKIVSYWYDVERAAKNAILHPGRVYEVRKHVKFLVKNIEGMPFLLMRLPSGRKLAYPKPRLCNDRIAFFGNTIGTNWGDVSTWGGKLVENAVQGTAADVMALGAHRAEAHGFEIVTLIHDQTLTGRKEGQTAAQLVEHLTFLPSWAVGLPLAAEGSEAPFYRKS